jgi:hypothetical protein
MHDKREPRTSYRVEVINDHKVEEQLTLSVTIYPPADVTVESLYRYDAIPEWIRIGMDLLDMASTKGCGSVPFFGSRASNVYWFHAEQVYEKSEKRC